MDVIARATAVCDILKMIDSYIDDLVSKYEELESLLVAKGDTPHELHQEGDE